MPRLCTSQPANQSSCASMTVVRPCLLDLVHVAQAPESLGAGPIPARLTAGMCVRVRMCVGWNSKPLHREGRGETAWRRLGLDRRRDGSARKRGHGEGWRNPLNLCDCSLGFLGRLRGKRGVE